MTVLTEPDVRLDSTMLDTHPAPALRLPAPPTPPRRSRRRVALLLAGTTALVAAGAGGAVVYFNDDPAQPLRPDRYIDLPRTTDELRDDAVVGRGPTQPLTGQTTDELRDSATAGRDPARVDLLDTRGPGKWHQVTEGTR